MAWFSLNPNRALQKIQSKKALYKQLKNTFGNLPDKSEDLIAVADDDWSVNSREPWVIKVNDKNYKWITTKSDWWSKAQGKFTKNGKLYTVTGPDDVILRWRSTAVKMSTPTTQMQELGSAWVLERVVNDNRVTYKKVQDIVDDKVTYDKLVKIFRGDVPEEWMFTYFAQQKKLFNHYNGNTPYNTFNRDGGFMDYISDVVTTKFGFSKKDSWNPADIWIIKGSQRQLEKEIDDLTEGKHQTVYELNDYLKIKYRRKEIMGLSLKKISGKKARFELVNIGKRDMYLDTSDPSANYPCTAKNFQSNFIIKGGAKNFTQDVRFVIKSNGRKKKTYDFQIKANSPETEGGSNLKFEATQKGAGGARLGKAPVDKIVELLHDMGQKDFVNDHNKYPKTLDEFIDKENEWKRKIEILISAGMKTDTKDINTIMNNIKKSYVSPKDRETNTACKIMGLDFFYSLNKLNEDKLREFATDMVYIAQKKATKKSDKFGPFGKVY